MLCTWNSKLLALKIQSRVKGNASWRRVADEFNDVSPRLRLCSSRYGRGENVEQFGGHCGQSNSSCKTGGKDLVEPHGV